MLGQLLARHPHKDRLGDPLGQPRKHVRLASPEHHRPQRLPDPIQALLADHARSVIGRLVLVAQLPKGPQPLDVDVLHDRDQLLQAILERRSRLHQRIGAVDALQRPRRASVAANTRRPAPAASPPEVSRQSSRSTPRLTSCGHW